MSDLHPSFRVELSRADVITPSTVYRSIRTVQTLHTPHFRSDIPPSRQGRVPTSLSPKFVQRLSTTGRENGGPIECDPGRSRRREGFRRPWCGTSPAGTSGGGRRTRTQGRRSQPGDRVLEHRTVSPHDPAREHAESLRISSVSRCSGPRRSTRRGGCTATLDPSRRRTSAVRFVYTPPLPPDSVARTGSRSGG